MHLRIKCIVRFISITQARGGDAKAHHHIQDHFDSTEHAVSMIIRILNLGMGTPVARLWQNPK